MSNPLVLGKDLGSLTIPAAASAYTAITAGGSGDDVAVVGLTIDRLNLTPNGTTGTLENVAPTGALFELFYECVLGAGNTISIASALVQDSADGSAWATVFEQGAASAPQGWPGAGVLDTGGTGGTTQRGVLAFSTDIKKCRRYVRFGFTPDLSAANTDAGKFVVSAVLSGIGELPPGIG
jgi:hypothetical protein